MLFPLFRANRPAMWSRTPPLPSADDKLARLADVTVRIDRTTVLRGLDLDIEAGEALGVTGANGSGKSTLLRVLTTLLPPAGGRGHVLGAELGTPECDLVRPRIGWVGHEPALYPKLTLRENLRLVARLLGRSSAVADQALEAVGLGGAATRRAEGCSLGMLRRADLARLIVTDPSFLLLDEVQAGLDASSIGLVDALVDRVLQRGGACVMVSHDRDRLSALVDRTIDLVDGRVVPTKATTPGARS